jgi:hypothetical protein
MSSAIHVTKTSAIVASTLTGRSATDMFLTRATHWATPHCARVRLEISSTCARSRLHFAKRFLRIHLYGWNTVALPSKPTSKTL